MDSTIITITISDTETSYAFNGPTPSTRVKEAIGDLELLRDHLKLKIAPRFMKLSK